jgi:hypothetical protein
MDMNTFAALTLTAVLAQPGADLPRPKAMRDPPPIATQAALLASAALDHAAGLGRSAAPPGGDSLKNGAIIGAVVGGVAAAAVRVHFRF